MTNDTINFPSGFISYTETFFYVAEQLSTIVNADTKSESRKNIISYANDKGGILGALPDIAREITMSFEQAYTGRDFDDGNFYIEAAEYTDNYILNNLTN